MSNLAAEITIFRTEMFVTPNFCRNFAASNKTNMDEVLHLINEMSPYLLLGFLFAGLMHAFIPKNIYQRYLSGQNLRSVINAALLGIPLPLCSCGVLPTAMSLRKEGASHSAVVSFLIATPQTGIDSIIATYSLMGLPFAIIRPIAALVTAVFGGLFTLGSNTPSSPILPTETHSCCNHTEAKASMSFYEKIKVALRYAYVDMVKDIGKWLVIGLIVAALITVFVPEKWFEVFKDNTALSMLLVLAISIPMYICATGSIPIAVALMLKGLTPGAALVLLMAGPAANMASILVIREKLGTRTLITYLASIITGAVLFGFVIDELLPREWLTSSLIATQNCHGTGTWFQWLCTAILCSLLINAFVFQRKKSCCCHDEEEHHCCHKEEGHDCCHEKEKAAEEHPCCCHHK